MTRLNISVFFACMLVMGCEREKRELKQSGLLPPAVPVVDLAPGGVTPAVDQKSDFDENAFAISQGKLLFSSYNCSGCHANGGGGMGPALMDDQWIYGYAPDQVYLSILEGRPQGMPTFRGRIPDDQIRQIAAYVRSLASLTPTAATAARDDHMMTKSPSYSPSSKPSPRVANAGATR